ncbi:MAG: hypothetical protein L3V56_11645 [Candidatus Magnetoovum sp. WYHC-5]|nr:hypothetical protein [Candidatus Magnetoovum sp. WYHC-5]
MCTIINRKNVCLLLMAVLFVFSLSVKGSCGSESDDSNVWSYNNNDKENTLEISYKFNGTATQYAVIDLDDSYFRMVYNSNSTWGTSVILLPSFWTKSICDDNDDRDSLCQGAPIEISTVQIDGDDLVISIKGTIGGLSAQGQLQFLPPQYNSFSATVNMTISGDVDLDTSHTGEMFKPVTLSSMHVSSDKWDTQLAFAGSNTFTIPQKEWIMQPQDSVTKRRFGLVGGTSANLKTNAPTVEIVFAQPLQIAGWVTASDNTDDDNIGFWAASNQLLNSWQYTVTVKPHYSVPIYRFYNANNTDHFYTISEEEATTVPQPYEYEGIGYYACNTIGQNVLPLYRFHNPNTGEHFFTISREEKNTVPQPPYEYEGTGYYVYNNATENAYPVYRFYNPDSQLHFFTMSETEKNTISAPYIYEGIAFYTFKEEGMDCYRKIE